LGEQIAILPLIVCVVCSLLKFLRNELLIITKIAFVSIHLKTLVLMLYFYLVCYKKYEEKTHNNRHTTTTTTTKHEFRRIEKIQTPQGTLVVPLCEDVGVFFFGT